MKFLLLLNLVLFSCNKPSFVVSKIATQESKAPQSVINESRNELIDSNAEVQLPPGHPQISGMDTKKQKTNSSTPPIVTKLKNEITIFEIFKNKTKYKNKVIEIKGQVVKYNTGIMGKNWLHLQDGTGEDGSNDLVVTTLNESALNQVVTVKGKIQLDRDIGSGYFFPIIIEDAVIKVQDQRKN